MGFAMSYSRDIKNFLCEIPLKRLCCKRALLYGMLSTRSDFANREIDFDTDNGKTCLVFSRAFKSVYSYVPLFDTSGFAPDNITGYKMKALPADITERVLSEADSVGYRFDEFFSCDSCRSCFFRGAFLAGGTISDPLKKGYHLEMLFKSEKMRENIADVLSRQGYVPKFTSRTGSYSLYFKDSAIIEDFLTIIGALHATMDLRNAKIMRDIRNNENRRSNCDTSNIYKSTEAAGAQLQAIKKLMENGRFTLLPQDLQQTAMLRLDNPECSLIEIAAMHTPPLTKSGVNHRMTKIIEFSKQKTD